MKSAQDVSNYGDFHYRGVDSYSKLDSDSKFDSHSKLDFHSKMRSSSVLNLRSIFLDVIYMSLHAQSIFFVLHNYVY